VSDLIVTEKHGPEYLLHKYWARKPANVVRAFIERFTPRGGLVLDPFCGSGTALIEASRLGLPAVGIDLNPVAVLIARTSTSRTNLRELDEAWQAIFPAWQQLCQRAYSSESGRPIDHCVHETLICCPSCEGVVPASRCKGRGSSRYACPSCGQALITGLAGSCGTRVAEVVLGGGRGRSHEPGERQTAASQERLVGERVWATYDREFLPNRRILSFRGMRASSLFTSRNFSLLCAFAEAVRGAAVSDGVRDCLLLTLTSAAASCSRLIPSRGNLAGGGPAWTVPGFWVPPVHLERNPALHLRARYAKLRRALKALAADLTSAPVRVLYGDAVTCLRALRSEGYLADYVFADPPYGDSVPYLEFCQVWNCWLQGAGADFGREIVVSDRTEDPAGWETYAGRLAEAFAEVRRVLRPNGHLTVTFNNLDTRAWEALLSALQAADFHCSDVAYQLPAVVSAKASFSPNGSYVGDIYATFTPREGGASAGAWDVIEERLAQAAELRGTSVSRPSQLKVAALSVLEQNLPASRLEHLEARFCPLPARGGPVPRESPLHLTIAKAIAGHVDRAGSASDNELIVTALRALPLWLAVDRHEILDVAAGFLIRSPQGIWRRQEGRPAGWAPPSPSL
jgi:16S rRNA G966 N2-methylase RsmD